MPASSPEEICRLFQQFMREGDLDAALTLYDAEAVFVDQSGKQTNGTAELRAELAPLAAAKTVFEFEVKQVIRAADVALMHTMWKVFSTEVRSVYAIEVARQQTDGSWRWLIGDPYTVGR